MPRLIVRELAEARGINMSQLQRSSGVTMPSVRRYWYNTSNGKAVGHPIKEIDLTVLEAIAKALGVETRDLIGNDSRKEATEEGNSLPMLLAA